MKKLLIITALILAPAAHAEYLYGGSYVSPESYAVNETDLTDYRYVAPSPKLDIDTLESMRITTVEDQPEDVEQTISSDRNKKSKKEKKKKAEKSFEERLSYKVAKWWVDQRYKREEEHHGAKHEIKVKARMENEAKE